MSVVFYKEWDYQKRWVTQDNVSELVTTEKRGHADPSLISGQSPCACWDIGSGWGHGVWEADCFKADCFTFAT